MASSVYLNGFPLLILLSIRSRESNANAFEIENDIQDVTGRRPSSGAVYSSLNNLVSHRRVAQSEIEIEGRFTWVFALTEEGRERLDWMLEALEDLKPIKEVDERGPRASGSARSRRRYRRRCRPVVNSKGE